MRDARASSPGASMWQRLKTRRLARTLPILVLVPALLMPFAVSNTAAASTVASDQFNRNVVGGWGSADVGGAYVLKGNSSDFATRNSSGVIVVRPGNTRAATIGSVRAVDSQLSFTVAFDTAPVTSSLYVYGVLRQVSVGNEYRAKVRFTKRRAWVQVNSVVGGVETGIGSEVRWPA